MATVELAVEPLIAGDHLMGEEFLRRWEARPEIKRAELIGGVVYKPSPLGAEHGQRNSNASCWLGHYAAHTPSCDTAQNATWFMLRDAPQPDCNLRILRECGGSSWIEGDYFHGAPELIAETCRSSTSNDLHQKKDLYAAAGVTEYVTILLREREVRWHRLVGPEYQTFLMPPDGIVRSVVFPGLWLAAAALLAGNMLRVLEVLDQGLKSADHAAFVARLAKSRS